MYVAEQLHDELVEALAERARAARVGAGSEEGVELGPLNNRPQFERVAELVGDALAGGATAVAGGAALERQGFFFAPTILTGLADDARIVAEEQFGPVLPVVPVDSAAEAIVRANDTSFGLCGSVWSSDVERARAVAAQLDCGTAWVNVHGAVGPHQPFGGWKWSGVGVAHGHEGLASFGELQVLQTAR